MKYVSIFSVISKSAITPFFSGWMTRISGGVRPIIALASLPTARSEWSSSWIDTIEGSLRTMPSPLTNTRVFDVPRSIATSRENLCRNIRLLSAIVARTQQIPPNSVVGRRDNRKKFSGACSLAMRAAGRRGAGAPSFEAGLSTRSRADGVEELGAGERLVEQGGSGGAEGFARRVADGSGRDEDEAVADRGAAGGDLSEQLEPVDAVQVEVGDHQVDPVPEVLAGLVGAGDGEGRAAGGLEVLEQNLLDRLIVLDDQDALAVQVDRPAGLVRGGPGGGADGQVDRERGALAWQAVGGDVAAVLPDDPVGDAEPEPGAGRALRGDEGVEDLRQHVGGDAGAGVLQRDPHAVRAEGPGGDPQAALAFRLLRHRLLGVGDQVDEDLLELVAVGPYGGQTRLHVPLDLHALDSKIGGRERQDLLDQLLQHHVATLERHLAAEGEEPAHDRPGRVGRLADHHGVFLEVVRGLLLEDVAGADEHSQWIVELVSDTGDELAERGQLRGLDHLLLGQGEAELLVLDDFLQPLCGLLRLLEEAGIVDGVGGVGGERVEELQIGLAEHARRARRDFLLREVDDADDPL